VSADSNAKECSGCAWFLMRSGFGWCEHELVSSYYSDDAREDKEDCGPSARYYRPKETAE